MKKLFVAALAAMTVFASCSKDDNGANTKEGANTTMGLSFTLPSTGGTRADGDDVTAKSDENAIKNIHVFIYETDGTAAPGNGTSYADIAAAFSVSGATYTLKEASRVETTAGPRHIYIAANLPSSFTAPATEAGLKKAILDWNGTNEWTATGGIPMCSQLVEASLVAQDPDSFPTENEVNAALERVVAKVVVSTNKSGLTFVSDMGNDITLTYAMQEWTTGIVAKSVYTAQNVTAGGMLTTPNANRTGHPADKDAFVNTVNASITNFAAAAVKYSYVGENAPEAVTYGEATYVMVRTQVTPSKTALASGSTVTWTNGFDGEDLFVVFDSEEDEVYFCDTPEDAEAVAGTLADGAASILKYPSRYVYFIVTLNETKTGKEGAVYRNQLIHVEITGVADGLFAGMPGKDDDDDGKNPPDPENPDLPDPFDPEEPIVEKDAYLLVNVTVKPWVMSHNPVELQ